MYTRFAIEFHPSVKMMRDKLCIEERERELKTYDAQNIFDLLIYFFVRSFVRGLIYVLEVESLKPLCNILMGSCTCHWHISALNVLRLHKEIK